MISVCFRATFMDTVATTKEVKCMVWVIYSTLAEVLIQEILKMDNITGWAALKTLTTIQSTSVILKEESTTVWVTSMVS